MRNILIIITTFTIILSVIGLSLNLVTNGQVITYLTPITINGRIMYIFDLRNYANNILVNINGYYRLSLTVPTDAGFLGVNYLILLVNITLYPLRIGGYMLGNVLAILGVNMLNIGSPIWWLVDFVTQLTELQIGYIY